MDRRCRIVLQKYVKQIAGGCWQGKSWTTKDGYCMINKDGKDIPLHVFMYLTFKGPIPEGLVLDHLCNNRKCCNPDHLESVTQLENVHRSSVVKLSTEDVAAIRQLYKAGNITQSTLAYRYNICQQHVGAIVNNRLRNIK